MEKECIIKAYRTMLCSRRFEETTVELFEQGLNEHVPHTGIGEEAVGVGTSIILEDSDYIAPTLRSKGAFFGKGLTIKEALVEELFKEGAKSKGTWTFHHVADMSRGILPTPGIIGSSVTIATGVALANRIRRNRSVVLAYFGDGAGSRGDFHAALNFAAVKQLPVVFVCENNARALSTDLDCQTRNPNIAYRAIGYGINGAIVDGQNIIEVMRETQKAVEHARNGGGPTLLEMKTYHFRGHSEKQTPLDNRDPGEHAMWLYRDPIKLCEEYLKAKQWATEVDLQRIRESVEQELRRAIDEAIDAPDVFLEDYAALVYAE